MRYFAPLLLACFLLVSTSCRLSSSGDAPASREDVERYFQAIHEREQLNYSTELIKEQMHRWFVDYLNRQSNLPPNFVATLDKGMESFEVPVDETVQAEIPIYQRHFTKRDIDALIAFYSTPIGKKYINESPSIDAEVAQAIAPIYEKMTHEWMQRIQEEVAQAEKAGNEKPAKKATQEMNRSHH